jgi:hypothetical protein
VPQPQWPTFSWDTLLGVFIEEHFRESTTVALNKDSTHAKLVQSRANTVAPWDAPWELNDLDEIDLSNIKPRSKISPVKHMMLQAIKAILEQLRRHRLLPTSDRVIHYKMLTFRFRTAAGVLVPVLRNTKLKLPYVNDAGDSYNDLTDILTRGRFEGYIDMDDIDDLTRQSTLWHTFKNPGAFMRSKLSEFFAGYRANRQLDQPYHIEIVIEKLTVKNIADRVAARYGIPVSVCRGQASTPAKDKLVRRFDKSGKADLIILLLTDLDPSGQLISQAFAESIVRDFDVDEGRVHAYQVALTSEQVRQYKLPPDMLAKESSATIKTFKTRHGIYAYELEALDPPILINILDQKIRSVLNIDLFNAAVEKENEALIYLTEKERLIKRFFDAVETGENWELLLERAATGEFEKESPSAERIEARRSLSHDFLSAIKERGIWSFLNDLKINNEI